MNKVIELIFNSFNNDFILTLFNLNYSDNDCQGGIVNGTVKLSENEIKVYELIKENNNINIDQFVLNTGISRRTVIRILNNLKDFNIIKRVGSDKTGHWGIV